MLEHTLDRAKKLVSPDRMITVIGKGHRRFLERSLRSARGIGKVVEQPGRRGTAAGIFLPASYIMAKDPDAIVLVFPSDHFVFPESRFLSHMTRAASLAESLNRLIILGVWPESPDSDYGWIEPGGTEASWTSRLRDAPRNISRFREKPKPREAAEFFNSGYMWNTMTMAVRVRQLWELGRRVLPEMMDAFERLRSIFEAAKRNGNLDNFREILADVYRDLPSADFSHDLLQFVRRDAVVLPLLDVEWSDWGRPERVIESLARIGRRPSFLGAVKTA